jgi:sulfur relay (sulfurtransferase) DsrF/TusC family protein
MRRREQLRPAKRCDLLDLIEKRNIPVYVVAEDLADRGIERRELVPGVQPLSRTELPGLFAEYAVIAHW